MHDEAYLRSAKRLVEDRFIMKLQILIAVALCATSPIESTSLFELLNSRGFSDFTDALVKHNMTNVNYNTEPMTVFAPSNEAFRFLMDQSEWKKNNMSHNHDTMHKMLGRLVVLRRKILPSDIHNEMIVETTSGEKLRLNLYPRMVTVNGVRIMLEPRIETHMTVVYKVNRIPAGLHENRDLIETLNRRKERFSSLLRAIEVANLKETLKNGGPFTLFAPTNEAFDALPPNRKLTKMMESPTDLKTLLLGHLMNGTYFLGGLMHSPNIHTLDGGSDKIVSNGTHMSVDGAHILLKEDMMAGNGVIHVIDRVLLPTDTISPK